MKLAAIPSFPITLNTMIMGTQSKSKLSSEMEERCSKMAIKYRDMELVGM